MLAGLPYDSACDVWSLGIILFTLLCGRHPFQYEDEAEEEMAVQGRRWDFSDSNVTCAHLL